MKTFIILLIATTAWAQSVAPFDVDPVLSQLDAAGKNLKSFTADVKLSEADPDTGDSTDRTGKVWYALDANGNPRIHVQLLKRVAEGKSKDDKIDYVLAGTDLIDRNERNKTQSTHHVLKPGEKIDLFKLGSGPFPLPIGQSKEDVHEAFDVSAVAPATDDPANTRHLKLIPKQGTRLARNFKWIDVWVDPKTGMPARIGTRDQRGDSARTTDLMNVQINEPVNEEQLMLPTIDLNDWQLLEDQYQR